MAGLAAIVDTQAGPERLQKLLTGMLQSLKGHSWHKPSGQVLDSAAMGRTSLEILNPGPQPVTNEEKSIYVCMEGEIHNYQYQTLKKQLVSAGYQFCHDNDPELVLHLYQEYGDTFVNDLNGSFIIMIWDCQRRRLVVVNDPNGSRPVYYLHRDQNFMVSSEIKAILSDPGVRREVDQQSVMEFLLFRHILGDKTPIKGIKVMPPGSILVFENDRIMVNQYWRPPLTDTYDTCSESEHVRNLTELYLRGVERQLDGDFPIGIYLSGGIDSRLIAAAATAVGKREELHAITRGVPGNRDSRFARMVARELGITHHFFEIEPNYLERVAEHGVWLTDGLMSTKDFYVLSSIEKVAEQVKVVFFGLGGGIFTGIGLSPSFNGVHDLDTLTRKVCKRFAIYVPEEMKSKLFTQAFRDNVGDAPIEALRACIAEAPYETSFSKVGYYCLKYRWPRSSLQGPLLARSYVETRFPFHDREVDEYACKIPPTMCIGRRMAIAMLKQINPKMLSIPWQFSGLPLSMSTYRVTRLMRAINRVRHEASWRTSGLIPAPTKIDQADYHLWFARDLRPWLEDILLSERTVERGYFQRDGLKQLIEEQANGRRDYSSLFGLLLTVELWSRIFIDGDTPKSVN